MNKLVKLSYSSMKTLQSCQQRYSHYKITNTPHDADYEESDALGLGKAVHQVLETTLHMDYSQDLIMKAMLDHNVDAEDSALIEVMLRKYTQYHKKSGLRVVKCELGIETDRYIGFIDALAVDETGGFWIIDLKTAGRHDPNTLPQLPKDMQLNLYAHFAETLPDFVKELKGLEFRGCRYRQIIKSKAKTASGLEKGVQIYDIEIPVSMMDPEGAWSLFNEVHDLAIELNQGLAPKKNYGACFNFFSPCPYFSKCHGHLFSEGANKVKIHTLESVEDAELL